MLIKGSRRLGGVVGLSLVCLVGSALSVRADDGWGGTDCTQASNPGCELTAGTGGANGEGSPPQPGPPADEGSGPPIGGPVADENSASSACTYSTSGYRPPPGATGSGALPSGGVWLDGLCSATDVIRTPEYVTALSPAAVAELARNQLRLPKPVIAASPSGDQLVNLPTWLWLSTGWRQVSATASVPGVSVTATAAPTSVSWSMGDGAAVICNGPGMPFRPGGDPTAPSPDCGHTYRTSSAGQPGQVFGVTAAVHWTVTWSGAGQNGTFPDLVTTSNTEFRVAESQALNSGG